MLGDPSGQRDSFPLVIEEFLNEAHKQGLSVMFYQIEREDLALYHDFGYNFFKLGEEAFVDMEAFTLSGKKKRGRAINNKFDREGYTFHVGEPPFSSEFIAKLKDISDEWLGPKKRKVFSRFLRPGLFGTGADCLRERRGRGDHRFCQPDADVSGRRDIRRLDALSEKRAERYYGRAFHPSVSLGAGKRLYYLQYGHGAFVKRRNGFYFFLVGKNRGRHLQQRPVYVQLQRVAGL